MIRNVCIHVTNEQPLLADLYDLPSATDAGLLCTNLRLMDGKRPIFIDSITATFFLPYHVIRFLEIPEGAVALQAPGTGGSAERSDVRRPADAPEPEPGSLLPVAVRAPSAGGRDGDPGADPDADLEIDEDFLQRIRDI